MWDADYACVRPDLLHLRSESVTFKGTIFNGALERTRRVKLPMEKEMIYISCGIIDYCVCCGKRRFSLFFRQDRDDGTRRVADSCVAPAAL